MRRALAALILLALTWPTSVSASTGVWSENTAYNLPQGRLEVGVFQTWRYGLSDRVEIGTHPVYSILNPQVRVKVHLMQTHLWDISSRHSVSYPTPLLRAISRRGTGGFLPADSSIPHLISLHNEVLATHQTSGGHLVTVHAGFRNAAGFGDMDLPTIDLPVAYPRTVAWTGGTTLEAGGDIYLRSMSAFDLRLGLDVFALPEPSAHFALEHKAMLVWNAGPRTSIRGGYLFTFGQYPFGFAPDILPLIDVVWAFN